MLDSVWPSTRPKKGDHSMFQPKARRIAPLLALTAALSLLPLADASAAARARTVRRGTTGISWLVQIEAQISSIWTSLQGIWSDAGVRMDDNG
jgi:hypothetical protein